MPIGARCGCSWCPAPRSSSRASCRAMRAACNQSQYGDRHAERTDLPGVASRRPGTSRDRRRKTSVQDRADEGKFGATMPMVTKRTSA